MLKKDKNCEVVNFDKKEEYMNTIVNELIFEKSEKSYKKMKVQTYLDELDSYLEIASLEPLKTDLQKKQIRLLRAEKEQVNARVSMTSMFLGLAAICLSAFSISCQLLPAEVESWVNNANIVCFAAAVVGIVIAAFGMLRLFSSNEYIFKLSYLENLLIDELEFKNKESNK